MSTMLFLRGTGSGKVSIPASLFRGDAVATKIDAKKAEATVLAVFMGEEVVGSRKADEMQSHVDTKRAMRRMQKSLFIFEG